MIKLSIILILLIVHLFNFPFAMGGINELMGDAISNKGETKDDVTCVIELEREGGSFTVSETEDVKEGLRVKLDALGYYESEITAETDKIKIEFKEKLSHEPEDIAEVICSESTLTFRDYEGTVLMEGTEEYIKDATMMYGQTYMEGAAEYYVCITFTGEGQRAFYEATEKVSGYAEEGNNYIAICIDEEIISMPVVNGAINSDSCIITGSFSRESAETLALQITNDVPVSDLKVKSVMVK